MHNRLVAGSNPAGPTRIFLIVVTSDLAKHRGYCWKWRKRKPHNRHAKENC